MGPFTRSEALLLAFMAFFALAGAVAGRLQGPAPVQASVHERAFPVRIPVPDRAGLSDSTNSFSGQIEKKLENGEVKININRAGAENLARLKGIGPALASRIIEYRIKNNGFKTVSELQNIKGIGPRKMAALRPMIEL